MSNWVDYFSNVRGHQIKKTMYEVLKERYSQNESIINRLSVALQTEEDIKQFFKLVTDVYEISYMKAVEDHKEQLKKAGYQARIVSPNQTPSKDG